MFEFLKFFILFYLAEVFYNLFYSNKYVKKERSKLSSNLIRTNFIYRFKHPAEFFIHV